MGKPTYIRAAILDWKNLEISSGRLFEILRVNYYEAFHALLEEKDKRGTRDINDIPAERIEELLCTSEILLAKVKQELKEVT